MKTIFALAVAALLSVQAAYAGQQLMIPCPQLADDCVITCVQLEVQTSMISTEFAPLQVEFLSAGGDILATAALNALSQSQTRVNLDTRVLAAEVDSIRLYSADGSGSYIGWAMLQVLCDPCACGCWNTVYKGCLCDWRPTVQEVEIVEPVIIEEPKIRLKRNPPAKREVVVVPGRG
jgi:hypothetical protein